jgi:lipid-A-disaccharide synthase
MSAPRIVVTTNGPGELMGWARPFLRAVIARAPDADITLVLVPCPYATGREAEAAQTMFPTAHVVDPKSYGRFLLNKPVTGMERGPGALQYLGGDLFHATTVARRLGLAPMTYKFTKRSYAQSFVRYFALDEHNAAAMRRDRAPRDRIRTVGNLVPDSVLGTLPSGPAKPGIGEGICIMPGSRPGEIKHGLPFFVAVARALRRLRPSEEISFVLSPFNGDEELRASLGAPPDKRMHGSAGSLSADGSAIEAGGETFRVDRSGDYHAVAHARLLITIPGTKCIEAAVLGRAMFVVVPMNRPDVIAVNGLAGYLHLVPIVGRPLKSWVVRAAERRFRFVTQPNIDAEREIVPELRGVLHPDDVATQAAAMLSSPEDLRAMGETLATIYASHIGAAGRMADEALTVASNESAGRARVAL